jgi:hypothetical protein
MAEWTAQVTLPSATVPEVGQAGSLSPVVPAVMQTNM